MVGRSLSGAVVKTGHKNADAVVSQPIVDAIVIWEMFVRANEVDSADQRQIAFEGSYCGGG